MNPGKSPGLGGLSLDYYRTFTDTLAPHFLHTINSLSSNPQTLNNLLEAHVTVIPKPGKDATVVTNYRPISLLNTDI